MSRRSDPPTGSQPLERAVRGRLHRLFVHLVAEPQLSYEAADRWLALHPETKEVLTSSLQTLWQTLSDDSEVLGKSSESAPISREARCELLAHAGLLRGINLALITSWRPSADTVEELEALYSGSLAMLATLGQALASALTRPDPSLEQLAGTREFVLKVNERAKQALYTSLMVGYGTGFLISDALDLQPDLTETMLASDDPGATAQLPDLPADSSDQVSVLDRHAASLNANGIRDELRTLLDEPGTRSIGERAMLEVSRFHPVSVPRSLPRFSRPFVEDMLAYLLRWWLGIGLRVHLQIAHANSKLPSEREALSRYAIGKWLAHYSRRWARSAINQFMADSADAERSQEHVFTLIQTALVSGRWLASQIDAAAPTPT